MPQKNGVTLRRHLELGQELHQIRRRLQEIDVEIGNAYPLTERGYKQLLRAYCAIDSAKSNLEDLMYQDLRERHGKAASEVLPYPLHVYYPGSMEDADNDYERKAYAANCAAMEAFMEANQ